MDVMPSNGIGVHRSGLPIKIMALSRHAMLMIIDAVQVTTGARGVACGGLQRGQPETDEMAFHRCHVRFTMVLLSMVYTPEMKPTTSPRPRLLSTVRAFEWFEATDTLTTACISGRCHGHGGTFEEAAEGAPALEYGDYAG